MKRFNLPQLELLLTRLNSANIATYLQSANRKVSDV